MTFLNLVESSANVESLTNLAREAFDIDDLVLVQANLLRYEDSEATRSINFVYLYWLFYVMNMLIFDYESALESRKKNEVSQVSASQVIGQNALIQ